jgi:uncharacterized protein YjiK
MQLLILYILSTISFDSSKLPFDVDEPTLNVELSKELKEISGLAWYKEFLAGVEDESGIVYLLSPVSGSIQAKLKFALPGDFEALEVIDKQFYALTSSGTIFSFNERNTNPIVISTPLNWKNDAEGLAFDDVNNRLLILCKESGGDRVDSDMKSIFAFNLERNELQEEPIATLSLKELRDHKDFKKYKPSGLAVDPLSCDLYVLSSVGKAIVVLNQDYDIKKVKKLSGKLFHQPEGIAFDPQGNLYICNEGSNKKKANFYFIKRN